MRERGERESPAHTAWSEAIVIDDDREKMDESQREMQAQT